MKCVRGAVFGVDVENSLKYRLAGLIIPSPPKRGGRE